MIAYLRSSAGLSYINSQGPYTIAGIEYARDQVKALVSTPDAQIDALFARVIDVLNGSVTAYNRHLHILTIAGSYDTTERSDARTANPN